MPLYIQYKKNKYDAAAFRIIPAILSNVAYNYLHVSTECDEECSNM